MIETRWTGSWQMGAQDLKAYSLQMKGFAKCQSNIQLNIMVGNTTIKYIYKKSIILILHF